jgi:hypothetical protein
VDGPAPFSEIIIGDEVEMDGGLVLGILVSIG